MNDPEYDFILKLNAELDADQKVLEKDAYKSLCRSVVNESEKSLRSAIKHLFIVLGHEDPDYANDIPYTELLTQCGNIVIERLRGTQMKNWTLDDYTLLKKRGLYP